MVDRNRLYAGIFTFAGVVLLILLLFFLGIGSVFERYGEFVTQFTESVQGLSVGSPVKYRGVPIGTVSRIDIYPENNKIIVYMKVMRKAFPGFREAGVPALNSHFSNEVKQGLRCRLEYTSLATGMRYIEFDYFGQNEQTSDREPGIALEKDQLFIPSLPSRMENLFKTFSASLERISRVRFEEISDNIVQNLVQMNKFLNDPELKSAIQHIEKSAESLDSVLATVSGTLTAERIDRTTLALERDLELLGDLAQQFSGVMERTSGDAADMKSDAANTLEKLNSTLDNLNELIEMLRSDPGSLLRGKQPKPESL